MRESTIESAVCAYAKAKGCLSLKLAGQNQKGQPDRMFLYHGRVLFVEFKAPGKRPTALQARWLDRLTDHAFHATTCDYIEAGKRLIDLITTPWQSSMRWNPDGRQRENNWDIFP